MRISLSKNGFIVFSIAVFFLSVNHLQAQSQKYWLVFKDKQSVSYDYKKHLSQRAIHQRSLLNIALRQYSDIPVNTNYLQELKKRNIKPIIVSKWLNAATVYLTENQLAEVRKFSFVKKVFPVERNLAVAKTNFEIIDTSYNKTNKELSFSSAISQLEPQVMLSENLNGKGIVIGVIDVGFYGANINPFLKGTFNNKRILGILDLVNPKKEDHFNEEETSMDTHGNMVLKMIAGKFKDEKQVGFATEAQFYLARSDHGTNETRLEEDNWIRSVEWLDSLGVRLVNTSLGYSTGFDDDNEDYKPSDMDGKTAMITKAAQIATQEKGMLIIVSAGNEGDENSWTIISAPADAKGVLSVGATTGRTFKIGYSSIGSEKVAYLKPNVAALSFNGTSFSAPLISGFAACLMQYQPKASSKTLFEIIQKSANLYPYGNNYVGYGIPKSSVALALLDGKKLQPTIQKKIVYKNYAVVSVENKSATSAIAFHKRNATIVNKQEYIKGSQGRFKIFPPKNTKQTIVIIGKKIMELFWKDVE